MSVYLDASVLVSLFTTDALSIRADAVLRARPSDLTVSDFAAAEFASAIARRVRMKSLTVEEAHAVFSTFDAWIARTTSRATTGTADIATATEFLRRLDLTLRTQDALRIAIAKHLAAELFTFDAQMAKAAGALGAELFGS